MVEMQSQVQSRRWWFDSHSGGPRRSPWLQSTLAELEEKTAAMLKLIEEDADSFAKRAEMYYKKRPELISMVENFYRAHRSLAERCDCLKLDSGTPRVLTNMGSPFSFKKSHSDKSTSITDQAYSNYDTSDVEEFAESEIEDLELEYEIQVDKEMNDGVSSEIYNEEEYYAESEVEDAEKYQIGEEVLSKAVNKDGLPAESKTKTHKTTKNEVPSDEMMKLRAEIEKLKDKNKIQKEQLMQKDEEKREVIRQLSLAVGVLKDDNLKLKKFIATTRESPKKWANFEFSKLKGGFLGKLFNFPVKYQPSIVAL